MNATANGSATIARGYLARGWRPIPIPPRTKAPKLDGWERLRIAESDLPKYFSCDCNIGVLNGEPSGNLVDVDLDHALARELADEFLPNTPAVFGRKSSRRSHRLYVVTGEVETHQRRLPKVDGKAAMIVELRSTGSQTVFPGSVHPEGESVEWDADGEPASVSPGLLIAAVNALAAEVEKRLGVTRREPPTNGRHGPLPGDVAERARKYLGKVTPAVSGQGGHDQTFHAACVLMLGFALDRETALGLLREWNQKCEPPWNEWELEHKIDDALEQPGERGYLLNGNGGGSGPAVGQKSGKPVRRPLTDLGNCERFAEQHGAAVRFAHAWSKWLVWNGRRWQPDDSGEVVRLAKSTARKIYGEATTADSDDEAKQICSWAKVSQSRARIEATLKLAESEQPIPANYLSLDADAWLLNFENGTLDLRTGQLRPHDPADLITKTTGIEYPEDPDADSMLWLGFLGDIFAGDVELIRYLQRLLGSAIVGVVREHVLPIFHGKGANGKSVFIGAVQSAIGDYAVTAPPGLLMAKRNEQHPTEIADLFGKRLVVISETKDGQRLDEGLVKAVTGGDKIRARRMREDFWEFTPSHTPVMVTNHRPMVRGTDLGIWRRLRLIPFDVTIQPERQDRKLPEKLKAELPGIAAWLVQGCLDWQREGLAEPPQVLVATQGYKLDSDQFGQWFQERVIVEPSSTTKASAVFSDYLFWCEGSGERNHLSRRRFGESIAERGIVKRVSNGTWYDGITLVTT